MAITWRLWLWIGLPFASFAVFLLALLPAIVEYNREAHRIFREGELRIATVQRVESIGDKDGSVSHYLILELDGTRHRLGVGSKLAREMAPGLGIEVLQASDAPDHLVLPTEPPWPLERTLAFVVSFIVISGGVGGPFLWRAFRWRARQRHLQAHGVEANARILETRESAISIDGERYSDLILDVAGCRATLSTVSPKKRAGLGTGDTIGVRYDPQDPSELMLVDM